MRKQWVLILLAAILLGVGVDTCYAAQKRGRSAAASRKTPTTELRSVDQLKAGFENDAGRVRLVALLSPT